MLSDLNYHDLCAIAPAFGMTMPEFGDFVHEQQIKDNKRQLNRFAEEDEQEKSA